MRQRYLGIKIAHELQKVFAICVVRLWEPKFQIISCRSVDALQQHGYKIKSCDV